VVSPRLTESELSSTTSIRTASTRSSPAKPAIGQPTFTLPERRETKKIALSRPADHQLPSSVWSLSKLAEFLVAEGVVDDISHDGLRVPPARRASAFK
jgi:hypothetical protein